MVRVVPYDFDRYLRSNELTDHLHELAAEHPGLVEVESYGTSHEGRNLWLVTITDASTGAHHTKPAHWVDANIHATELTGGVAALYLIHHLVTAFAAGDATVVDALRTRTFYVAPRVNPDGVELALADSPTYLRSSTRPWPWLDGHRWPGMTEHDLDGDGRVLTMRVPDPNGAWVEHREDARLMVQLGPDGITDQPRYRLLREGTITDYDGFTVPVPRDPQGLDLNRNFPAGWGTSVPGSGDHPLSEPETDALVRAITSRPNVCGYNAFHTYGGVLLRPSSTKTDAALPPLDVWAWKQLGERGTALTGYRVHSVFEDFTWDKDETASGAADDWAYEHLGVFGWTTEFWDVVAVATGERVATDVWFVGPTTEQELAVLRWSDDHAPGTYVRWYPFDHPQLGPVELGGPDFYGLWANPPAHLLRDEVAPHAQFAVFQALASPRLEVLEIAVERLGEALEIGDRRVGDDTWRIQAGIANTGWLPTDVTRWARKQQMVLPATAEVSGDGIEVLSGAAKVQLGQLEGRAALRVNGWALNDGTAERTTATWVVRAAPGTEITVEASHPRAGTQRRRMTLS
jgi:hypothetical protein